MVRIDYNKDLVARYGTRVISVNPCCGKYFSVLGTQFSFHGSVCPDTGKPMLKATMTFPDGSSIGAEQLVLLIKGRKPFRDIAWGSDGRLESSIPSFRLSTRLAKRDFSKPRRRRKYLQEQRRAAEAAQIDE
jgi:hypothetical protein